MNKRLMVAFAFAACVSTPLGDHLGTGGVQTNIPGLTGFRQPAR